MLTMSHQRNSIDPERKTTDFASAAQTQNGSTLNQEGSETDQQGT